MKRWVIKERDYAESPDVDAFLDDIERVCLRHNLCITHEHKLSAFKVEMFNEDDMNWLRGADDAR